MTVGAAMLAVSAAATAAEPTLEVLAFDWAGGRYVSPVICEVDGKAIAGGRYFEVVIRDPRRGPDGLELVFEDLDADEASRCFDDLGRSQQNIVGALDLVYRGRSRPGMAMRDFRERLKRERGFEYSVRGGGLALNPIGEPRDGAATARKSFKGATVSLTKVRSGSDEDRLLTGLRGQHRVVLEISGASLPKLRIPAVRLGHAGQERNPPRR